MKCKCVLLRTSFFTSFWFKVLTPVGNLVQNLSRPRLLNSDHEEPKILCLSLGWTGKKHTYMTLAEGEG